MEVFLVPQRLVESIWPKIEQLMIDACAYNGDRYEAEDYLREIVSGEKQLWLATSGNTIKGVIITQIMPYPKKLVCNIDICTGFDLAEWGNMVHLIEDWGRSKGCKQLFVVARPGMQPLLKANNYKKTHVLMEKDL